MNGRPEDMAGERPKAAQAARRRHRLGAALRENLKRRKAQARSRAAADGPAEDNPHDSAGIGSDKQGR
jgi:hypothetical protein